MLNIQEMMSCDLFDDSIEKKTIKGYLDSDIPFYMHGPTGVGKSARIKEIDPQRIVIYLRNAAPEVINGKSAYSEVPIGLDEEDLDEFDGMIDCKPTWLAKLERLCEKDKNHLHFVFFDELSNAYPSIQSLVFNIILSKEVNGIWRLPTNSRVVAAGNEALESLAAFDISKPLFSRLAHIYIKDDYKGWIKWACRKGIHPLVISFIANTKNEYFRTPYTGKTPNADPRKWEMVSNVLYKSTHLKVLYNLLDQKTADAFINYCMKPLVPIDAIIRHNLWNGCMNAAMNMTKRDDLYSLVSNLSMCPEEYIDRCYPIVTSLGEDITSLFAKMWTRGNNERMTILGQLHNSLYENEDREKVLSKR